LAVRGLVATAIGLLTAGGQAIAETPPSPKAQPLDAGGATIAGPLPHSGDFLTNPACNRGTRFYPAASATERKLCRDAIKSRGYTHIYLAVASPYYDFYGNASGFRSLLQELVDDGIAPVVWLTNDSSTWKDQPIADIEGALSSFVPLIDTLVSSYSLGIEIDEYWTRSETDQIGNHLQALTKKLVAAHQLPGRWAYCQSDWCDYMILQYGFGKDESFVKEMTVRAKRELGKPVVAGEYNLEPPESTSVRLGNAGVAAGAAGFGNGGTPVSAPSRPQSAVLPTAPRPARGSALGEGIRP
jgi:hypothetical protein